MHNLRVPLHALCALFMVVYSITLLSIEWQTSQKHVRPYFSDIEQVGTFFGVNTSLCFVMLAGTALISAVSYTCIRDQANSRRKQWFFLSQVAVFGYLGLDDRLLIHERVTFRINQALDLEVGDHWILLTVAVAELIFLWILGRDLLRKSRAIYYLGIAGALFCVMIVIDAWFPHDMFLRLSLEDLTKSWAVLFFFQYAWELCSDQVTALKNCALPAMKDAPREANPAA